MNEREALRVILDCVDYTVGNCRPNEMVGAVLSPEVIELAREVLRRTLESEGTGEHDTDHD
jgi:hypothetical protein